MNLEVESALAAWLRATPAFDGLPVHTGQSSDPIPNDQPVLIVGVENTELIAVGFYRITASIVLATPCILDGALDTHSALSTALRDSLLAADDLAAAFPSSLQLAGADLRTLTEAQQNDRWLTTAALSLGLVAI